MLRHIRQARELRAVPCRRAGRHLEQPQARGTGVRALCMDLLHPKRFSCSQALLPAVSVTPLSCSSAAEEFP